MIVTYGSGEVLYRVFTAISLLLNGNGHFLNMLLRTGMAAGGFGAICMTLFGDQLTWLKKWFIPSLIITQFLLIPQKTVWIKDPVLLAQYKVDKVPAGLALIAELGCGLSEVLTEGIEKAFMLPDDIRFSQGGPMLASKLLTYSKAFCLTNPTAQWNMMNFVNQCIVLPALNGYLYTLDDVKNSTNLWELISSKPSDARWVAFQEIVSKGTPQPRATVCSCRDAMTKIKKMLDGAIQQESSRVGWEVFQNFMPRDSGVASKTTGVNNPSNLLKQYIPATHKMLTKASKSAEDVMLQDLMIHEYIRGIEAKSVALGNSPNLATRKAYLQHRASLESAGVLAAEFLCSARGIIEAVVYAMFLFIIPLSLLPSGYTILLKWFQACIWIQLWPPLYSILNTIMTYSSLARSRGALHGIDGITIANLPALADANADMMALTGWLSLSIPIFAWMMLDRSGVAFSSFASSIVSPAQSAAATAGYEKSTGNYSLGNVSTGNYQISQVSAFQSNTAGNYTSGAFRSSDGIRDDTVSFADGSSVSHSDVSKVGGVEAQTTWNTSTQHTMQAMEADRASQSQSIASQEAFASSARDLVEYGRHRSEQKAHGHSESLSDTSSFAKHADQAYEIAHRYAEEHGISDQKATELMLKGGVNASASADSESIAGKIVKFAAGATGSGSMQGLTRSSDTLGYQDTKNVNEQSSFKETVNAAAQAAKSEQLTINNDEGKRYAQNVSSSFEQSQRLSQDAQASHAKSIEFLESAQKTQGISSTVTRNDIPWLLEEFAKEKLPNGTAIGGGAAYMAQNQPEFFASFAQRKINERNAQVEQYATAHGLKPDHNIHSQISGFHEQNAHAINSSSKTVYSSNNDLQGTQQQSGNTSQQIHKTEPTNAVHVAPTVQQQTNNPYQSLQTQEQNNIANSTQAIQQQAGNLSKPLQTQQFEEKFNKQNHLAQNQLENNKIKQEGEKIKQGVEAEQDSSVSKRAIKTAWKAGKETLRDVGSSAVHLITGKEKR